MVLRGLSEGVSQDDSRVGHQPSEWQIPDPFCCDDWISITRIITSSMLTSCCNPSLARETCPPDVLPISPAAWLSTCETTSLRERMDNRGLYLRSPASPFIARIDAEAVRLSFFADCYISDTCIASDDGTRPREVDKRRTAGSGTGSWTSRGGLTLKRRSQNRLACHGLSCACHFREASKRPVPNRAKAGSD